MQPFEKKHFKIFKCMIMNKGAGMVKVYATKTDTK